MIRATGAAPPNVHANWAVSGRNRNTGRSLIRSSIGDSTNSGGNHPAKQAAHQAQKGPSDTGGGAEPSGLVDAFGSPAIQSDLATFDAQFSLPAPPSIKVIQPAGPVGTFDPATMDGWAGETTLDVEWSHAMAPGANILLVETPVAETEGTAGFPQIVEAENYVVNHHLGDVISQSFGATEQTFPGTQPLLQLRSAYLNAYRHHVTVLAATGDTASTGYSNTSGTLLFTHRAVDWPASDPLVTGVGAPAPGWSSRTRATPASRPAGTWSAAPAKPAPCSPGSWPWPTRSRTIPSA
ncbi:MAG TPA: hypothetical protein VHY31_24930 [Streptosporangiaceae bacterium]|nr:hypothetical protein [Streptosporangiaceae bacterium]